MSTQVDLATASLPEPLSRSLVMLHWLMAGLFAGAVIAIVARGMLPSGHMLRPLLRSAHLICGQMILMLAVLRLVVRWRHSLPEVDGVPRWAASAGRAAHAALYAVMLLQPISGIVFMQAGDKTVSFFGLTLPQWVPSDKMLHAQVKDWHILIGYGFYALLALHVSAALWHHYVLRNNTLHRMLGRTDQQYELKGLVSKDAEATAVTPWHLSTASTGAGRDLSRRDDAKRTAEEFVD